jgi:hypothetical protein
MRRLVVPLACIVVGIVLGVAGTARLFSTPATRVVVRAAAATAPVFVPACPHLAYGADGTIGPLLCTIDNPVALKYYATALKPLLALGPNANPAQVENVLAQEFRVHNHHAITGTYPIQCQVFQLAAHRWRWRFFYAPPYCSLPPNT